MWAVNAEQKEMLWPRPALLLLLVNNKEDPAVAEQKKIEVSLHLPGVIARTKVLIVKIALINCFSANVKIVSIKI